MTAGGRKSYTHHRVRPVQPPVRRSVQWETYWLWTLFGLAVVVSLWFAFGGAAIALLVVFCLLIGLWLAFGREDDRS